MLCGLWSVDCLDESSCFLRKLKDLLKNRYPGAPLYCNRVEQKSKKAVEPHELVQVKGLNTHLMLTLKLCSVA